MLPRRHGGGGGRGEGLLSLAGPKPATAPPPPPPPSDLPTCGSASARGAFSLHQHVKHYAPHFRALFDSVCVVEVKAMTQDRRGEVSLVLLNFHEPARALSSIELEEVVA